MLGLNANTVCTHEQYFFPIIVKTISKTGITNKTHYLYLLIRSNPTSREYGSVKFLKLENPYLITKVFNPVPQAMTQDRNTNL